MRDDIVLCCCCCCCCCCLSNATAGMRCRSPWCAERRLTYLFGGALRRDGDGNRRAVVVIISRFEFRCRCSVASAVAIRAQGLLRDEAVDYDYDCAANVGSEHRAMADVCRDALTGLSEQASALATVIERSKTVCRRVLPPPTFCFLAYVVVCWIYRWTTVATEMRRLCRVRRHWLELLLVCGVLFRRRGRC